MISFRDARYIPEYDFYTKGFFSVPDIHPNDISQKSLVMITSPGRDWHVLSVLTERMINAATPQIHNNYISLYIIIPKLADDSESFIKLWMEGCEYDENSFLANQYTWDWIANEIHHIKQLEIQKLEKEIEELKLKVMKKEKLKRLRDEYWEERRALEAERAELKEEKRKRKTQPKTLNGYVYILKVIGHDNLYKIGRTKNPANRLKTFSVKLPFIVDYEHLMQTDDMYKLENELHKKFRSQRQRGSEFFLLGKSDIQYLKTL